MIKTTKKIPLFLGIGGFFSFFIILGSNLHKARPYGCFLLPSSYTPYRYNNMSIDWTQEVKEYKKQYPDDTERHYNMFEFIDGYLPIYYGEIIETYGRIHGSPLSIEIIEGMVGATISQILVAEIQEAYIEEFESAWREAEEEE